MPRTAIPFANVAEMREQLGGIDPRRVRSWPPPGKTTVKDLLRVLECENRTCELVDGILVEKARGYAESALAMLLGRWLGNHVEDRDLGIILGADGVARILLVWIVDPETRTVTVHTGPEERTILTETDTLTGGDVLPGFSLPLAQLFARVSRSEPKPGAKKPKGRRRDQGRR
jgi:hypothetical protein